MDADLLRWARAVKARQRKLGRHHPALWLFTDPRILCPVVAVLRGLPWRGADRGLCGVVWRSGSPDAAAERICRFHGLALSVAGRAGGHRRDRRGPVRPALTAAAHGVPGLRRAATALPFLSPAFPTLSHPGAAPLGPVRWAKLARTRGGPVLALGGVDGQSCRRLPRWCAGAGAISALLPTRHSVS